METIISGVLILISLAFDAPAVKAYHECKPSMTLTRDKANFFIVFFVSSTKDGEYNPNTLMHIEQVKHVTDKVDVRKQVSLIVYDICDDEKNAIDLALYLGGMYTEAHKIDDDFDRIIGASTINFAEISKLINKIGISINVDHNKMKARDPLCPCHVQEIRQIFAIIGDLSRDTERAIS